MSDQYSGNTIGGTYRSKRSNVLIATHHALRELDTLGTTIDQLEESKNLDVVRKQFDVVKKHMIASEKTCSELGGPSGHFTVHNDGLITMKKNIDKQDVIEEAIEAIEFSEDPIEDYSSEGKKEDYSSEVKKESRSYAYHRLDANGKPITKAINAGLFIVHDKLMDIVQAWNEGLIDKHTQLVLVSGGSVEKIKVVDILSSNFDLILENTTKEMGYDSVPSFDKSPRFWHKSIHTLKENSKCDYNENGFVWSDLKGKIQYAFLDYCGNNNFKYMNWYEQVLYPMMSNTAHVAINHYSYVRGNSSWRDICKKFLDACHEATNAIGCFRWLQNHGKMDDFKSRYEDGLYAIHEAYGHDDIEHSVIQFLGLHSIILGSRRTREIIDSVCEKNPNLMIDDRIDDDAWDTYIRNSRATGDKETLLLHSLNTAYGSMSLEASHKTEFATESFDFALITSAFWKAIHLDHKNPQGFVTTPQAAEAVREVAKNIRNNKSRFSPSWKDVQATHDDMHPYDMDRYEYLGSHSSKMVIHKFIIFKQAPKFKHKPNLSMDHPRQTSTLKHMLECSTIYERFSPHSLMLLNIEETEADTIGTATNYYFDEDGSIMFEGLNLYQSNRFSDEFCVKNAMWKANPKGSLSGCVRGIVQCFAADLFSDEMDEHMSHWKHEALEMKSGTSQLGRRLWNGES